MITHDLKREILFSPIRDGANELFILSGYATPSMASWFITTVNENYRGANLTLNLMLGMVPESGLSLAIHQGFNELLSESFAEIKEFNCSYVYKSPAVHSKVYVWLKNGDPYKAFLGSANFSQVAFGNYREEVMVECDVNQALNYYNSFIGSSIYCNADEVEEHVIIKREHPVFELENVQSHAIKGSDTRSETLSLLTRDGDVGTKSGINWGQRPGRNPNQAYIPLPVSISTKGFFPLEKKHFTVTTDDKRVLILRVEQQNNKAITTPHSNALLGEYLRSRINVGSGEYVTKAHLEAYGRTDITFYKIDEEQFYMDFSVPQKTQ